MFLIAPWLAWLAAVTSGILLIALWSDFSAVARAILATCFAVATYGQFFSPSPIAGAAGLALQTLLAVYLIVCWKLDRASSR